MAAALAAGLWLSTTATLPDPWRVRGDREGAASEDFFVVEMTVSVTHLFTVSSFLSSGFGGGLALKGGSSLVDSRITACSASVSGGGLGLYVGATVADRVDISDCESSDTGGCVSLRTVSVRLSLVVPSAVLWAVLSFFVFLADEQRP